MNNNDINKLSQNLPLVVLLASSLLLLFFKVYFAFEHGRYLAFGLDSARVLRVTQELSSMGSVDWFASGRVGLPIFAWLVSSAAGLTASNYFVIPLFLSILRKLPGQWCLFQSFPLCISQPQPQTHFSWRTYLFPSE